MPCAYKFILTKTKKKYKYSNRMLPTSDSETLPVGNMIPLTQQQIHVCVQEFGLPSHAVATPCYFMRYLSLTHAIVRLQFEMGVLFVSLSRECGFFQFVKGMKNSKESWRYRGMQWQVGWTKRVVSIMAEWWKTPLYGRPVAYLLGYVLRWFNVAPDSYHFGGNWKEKNLNYSLCHFTFN